MSPNSESYMGLGLESAASAPASLAPGFRFHPTDDELVRYYLKRKVCGKAFRFDAISEIDIYKCEPWDLPGMSRLKSRDLEWYFFSVLDKKYGNGSKTNRATERGYWKTTGKDRPVLHYSRTVGMKKTLVYHSGRAPRGERSNYVMHEYRLIDEALEKAGLPLDMFVLCRVFQKSGSGPKNGEKYGAPFVEEEWEEDELIMVPGEGPAEELADTDDAYLDGNDLEQILDSDIPSEDVPLPMSFYYEDNNSYVQEGVDLVDDDQKLFYVQEAVELVDDEKPFVDLGQNNCGPEQPDGHKLFEFPVETDVDPKPVRHEYIGEPNNTMNDVEEDYLLDEPYVDATCNIPLDDGLYLETNDLSNPIKVDPSGFDTLEEYLTFFDGEDDNSSQYMAFNPSKMKGSEIADQVSASQMCVNGDARQGTTENQHLVQDRDKDVASSSKQKPGNFGSDFQYPFLKQASCMLGSIPAPPAFASEFPSKLHSASHPSNPIHVTAGMIQIRNMTLSGNGTFWSLGKNADVTIILSFDLPHNTSSSASLEPMDAMVMGKAGSVTSDGWLYLIFMWVLILSVSFKIGSCMYTCNAL